MQTSGILNHSETQNQYQSFFSRGANYITLKTRSIFDAISAIPFNAIYASSLKNRVLVEVKDEDFQKCIAISKHVLHLYLCDAPKKSNNVFSRSRDQIALLFKELRGNSDSMRGCLNQSELKKLFSQLADYLNSKKIMSDDRDFSLIHSLMCDLLLRFSLDESDLKVKVVESERRLSIDPFKKLVDFYFEKLANELKILITQETSSLEIWLESFKSIPGMYLGHLFVACNGNEWILIPLGLTECGCIDVSHDRLLGDVRLKVESIVLDSCKQLQESLTYRPLKILGLGVGGGLQDFILVWKLLRLGVHNIELSFVEPCYKNLLAASKETIQIWDSTWTENDEIPQKYYRANQDKIYNVIRAISLLSRIYKHANISLSLYPSMTHFLKENRKIDIAYAIDFEDYDSNEDAKKDFHSIADVLSENGLAILSQHYQIDTFNSYEEARGHMSLKQKEHFQFDKIEQVEGGGYRYRRPLQNFFH